MGIHRFVGAAALSCILGGAALAQQDPRPPRSIPYYQAHGAERDAVLRQCRTSHAYGHNIDCLNADTAGTLDWGLRSAQAARHGRAGGALFPQLSDPSYWASNSLARTGVLAACGNSQTGYAPSTCAAARQGQALASRRPS